MKIFATLLSIMFCVFCIKTSAGILLTAKVQAENNVVTLQWNMPDYAGNTGYTLFKSDDGVVWQPAAANHVYRSYMAAATLAYNDKSAGHQKVYYKVKV